MKRLFILSCLLMVCTAVFAGNLNPPAAPISGTMKTLNEVEPRIIINGTNTPGDDTCTYKITQSGSYYLTGDFTSNFKHGILIAAHNVTIDLMGYEIRSSWNSIPEGASLDFDGIYIQPQLDNIEIRNGTVYSNDSRSGIIQYNGFRHGIHAAYTVENEAYIYSQNIRALNLRVTGCREFGVLLYGANITVKSCTVSDNGGCGIKANKRETDSYSVKNYIISENTCYNNGAIGIYTGTGAVVTGNSCCHNGSWGINANSDCVISNNTCNFNGETGIYAWYGNLIENNTCNHNTEQGIYAHWYNRVNGNVCYANQQEGILNHGRGTVTHNTCCENQYEGIKSGEESLIDGNTAYHNNQSGGGYANLSASASCTLGLNHAP